MLYVYVVLIVGGCACVSSKTAHTCAAARRARTTAQKNDPQPPRTSPVFWSHGRKALQCRPVAPQANTPSPTTVLPSPFPLSPYAARELTGDARHGHPPRLQHLLLSRLPGLGFPEL